MATMIQGILEISKVIIASLIVFYSIFFLRKTEKQNERKPWVFLSVAAILFLSYSLIAVMMIFFFDNFILFNIRLLLELAFTGLVLLAFIAQHNLIVKNSIILITKKKGSNTVEVKRHEPEHVDMPPPPPF